MFGAHRVGEFSRFRQATFLYRFIINKILISQSKHLYCYRNLRNASLLFFTCDSNQLHDKGIVEQYALITDVNNFGNVLKNVAMSVHDLDVFSQHVLPCLWCFIFLFFVKNYAFLIFASLFLKMPEAMKRAFN